MTIYIVTQGYYSDYCICGVFTTKELAEKFIKAYSFESAEIEEYNTDVLDERVNKGLFCYRVAMDKQGNNAEANKGSIIVNYKDFFGYDSRIYNTVWARDEKHAIKIANEKRIRVLIENRWED